MRNPIRRRGLLQAGVTGATMGLAGSETFGGEESAGGDSDGFDCVENLSITSYDEYKNKTGWFSDAPLEWYCAIRRTITGLRAPWERDPEEFYQEYTSRLVDAMTDLVLPGVTDAVPIPDTVPATQDIIESSIEAFELLNEA